MNPSLNVAALLARVASAKGWWFPKPGTDYDLFVFGVRGSPRIADAFDDLLGVVWWADGAWHAFVTKATTDPGVAAMTGPSNPRGVARIMPGQYRGVWKLGKRGSNGKTWLAQIGRFHIRRDRDLNTTFNETADKFNDGRGLGLHAPWKDKLTKVGRASEGCQVPHTEAAAEFIFDLVRKQDKAGLGTTCSYTLLDLHETPEVAALFLLDEQDAPAVAKAKPKRTRKRKPKAEASDA